MKYSFALAAIVAVTSAQDAAVSADTGYYIPEPEPTLAEKLFELMESGYERHYLKIVAYHEGRKMAHGLACVNIDQNYR